MPSSKSDAMPSARLFEVRRGRKPQKASFSFLPFLRLLTGWPKRTHFASVEPFGQGSGQG